MVKNENRVVTGLIIAFQLLTLWYVYPKVDTPRATFFEVALSKVCFNSNDLFDVNKKAGIFRNNTWNDIDERVVMYYSDLMPRENKKYWIYFGPLPYELSKYYYLTIEDGIKIYLINGLTWERFKEHFSFILDDYHKGNETYIIGRD